MSKNNFLFGIAGLVIGGFLVWFLISSNVISSRISENKYSVSRYDQMDAHFIEQMIPHHEDAITMAKLAQAKAKTQEVKDLSEDIILSQGKEIEQMKVWYKEWFGKDVLQDESVMSGHGMMGKSGMHMGRMGDDTDIKRLERTSDFDSVFVEEMIPHHQMAVMMARMLLNSTQRKEMKSLAEDIIKAQEREIAEMRKWYRNWNA